MLSSKQKREKSAPIFERVEQFETKWNFGGITESLLNDVFIVNMVNKEVQKKLCLEPKGSVDETIQIAIANEEGRIRQSFDKMEKPNIKAEVKETNNINQRTERWCPNKKCFRCERIFTTQHLNDCKTIRMTCMKCGEKDKQQTC